MTEIQYYLLDPTGNQTVLVETSVPEKIQPAVAKQIMECEPEAEQVGFVSFLENSIEIRMAGGEFCGNAAMSAGVLYAVRHNLAKGLIPVSFFGCPYPIAVAIQALSDGGYKATVNMPPPVSVEEEMMPDGKCYPVARFNGISHIIVETTLERNNAEKLAFEWCRYLKAEAIGIMQYNRKLKTLTPLVYVPSADTLCWESSCASGTTAVGAYLSKLEGPLSASIQQPGGSLNIEVTTDGKLLLTGLVHLLKHGNLILD